MDAITLTPVDAYRNRCPVCDHLDAGLTFKAEPPLPHDPLGRGDFSEYAVCFHKGTCQSCKETIFTLEITVLSDAVPEIQFIDDGIYDYEEENKQAYHAALPGIHWALYHHRSVTCGSDPDLTHDWMDKHFIGPFVPTPADKFVRYIYPDTAPQELPANSMACQLLKKLGPHILALKWS